MTSLWAAYEKLLEHFNKRLVSAQYREMLDIPKRDYFNVLFPFPVASNGSLYPLKGSDHDNRLKQCEAYWI